MIYATTNIRQVLAICESVVVINFYFTACTFQKTQDNSNCIRTMPSMKVVLVCSRILTMPRAPHCIALRAKFMVF